jgi:hypothetical protein
MFLNRYPNDRAGDTEKENRKPLSLSDIKTMNYNQFPLDYFSECVLSNQGLSNAGIRVLLCISGRKELFVVIVILVLTHRPEWKPELCKMTPAGLH